MNDFLIVSWAFVVLLMAYWKHLLAAVLILVLAGWVFNRMFRWKR